MLTRAVESSGRSATTTSPLNSLKLPRTREIIMCLTENAISLFPPSKTHTPGAGNRRPPTTRVSDSNEAVTSSPVRGTGRCRRPA